SQGDERPGRLSVEDQDELCRLLDRQIARFRALENPVDEIRSAIKEVGKIDPIADQPTASCQRIGPDCTKAVVGCKLWYLFINRVEDRVVSDGERISACLPRLGNRALDLICSACVE